VEAALGPFLQALVVSSPDDALACAEWLRARGAGHALLIWPPDAACPLPAPPPRDGEELGEGLASHIDAQPELRPLLERLLAGSYIVRDLEAAHHVLGGTPSALSPKALVTPTGELRHRDGWVRGGSTGGEPAPADSDGSGDRAGTLLARERERRQLPAELDRWTAEIAELEARRERADQIQREHRDRAATLQRALQAGESRAQELARQVATLQREAERAESEQQLSQAVADQLAAETAGLEQEVNATTKRVAELEAAQQEALERVRDAQEAQDSLIAGNRIQQEELARARTALALQRQEAKALAERAEQVRSQAHELTLQIERRAERVKALATQRAQLDKETTRQQETVAELRARLRDLSGAVQQQEAELTEDERDIADSERHQAHLRQEVGNFEVDYRRRMVDAQRARDAVEALQKGLREELAELGEHVAEVEPADLAALVGLPDAADSQQGAAAPNLMHEEEPAQRPSQLTPEEAARMRRQIDQLRNRVRHLGGYDPDAPQAYEELKTRYDFLTSQVRDMEQASTNLRAIIAELDATMRRQFAETFQAVNLRFQRHFATLFSGGSARLEMTAPRRKSTEDDDEDDEEFPADHSSGATTSAMAGGIEIFVSIPGKRVQDLALLSGGERAMVSVALLFALLETNPPPFCLLDEVDAALDEANVVRFCDILKRLAERTQFIVITHNRVTMTHARAIYGISMGGDSVSRFLSMRLAEATAAAAR
jgi:chromosome segregation protein